MNEAVGIKNRVTMNGGGKRLVRTFKRQEFWKCIGFILQAVTYGKKGHKLWEEIHTYVCNKVLNKIHRYINGNTDVLKVHCDIYHNNSSLLCH